MPQPWDNEAPPSPGAQAVLDWLRTHHVQDKDAASAASPSLNIIKPKERDFRKSRNPAAWNFPLPELEIDLHNHTVDEALARIDEAMEAMERSGLSCLRVVHGGGNPGYGPIKRALDRSFRTVWKHRVSFYRTEPDNMGSSLLKLAHPLKKK